MMTDEEHNPAVSDHGLRPYPMPEGAYCRDCDGTGIEWTDATWNPLRGCTKVDLDCRNCYAERVASPDEWQAVNDAPVVEVKL